MIVAAFIQLSIQNHPLNMPFLYGYNGTGLVNFFVGGIHAIFLMSKKNLKRVIKNASVILAVFLTAWVCIEGG